MTSRLKFLAGAATTAAISLNAARAEAMTTVTTQFSWINDVQYAGFWFADDSGFFRKAGIKADLLPGGATISSVEALVAAGRADVGIDPFERVIDANFAGADLVVVGALYQQNPAALLSLQARPVRSPRDMLGKRLGLQQGARIAVDAILRLNRLPLEYTEVVVGSDPEPLIEGACDAMVCYVVNQPLALATKRIPYVTATYDQLGYHSYGSVLFCRRDYLRTHRAVLVNYLWALQRGWTADFRDPARGVRLAVESYGASLGLDARWQAAVNVSQIPLMQSPSTQRHGLLWIDLARVAGPIYASLGATGRPRLPRPESFIDVSLLEDARRIS